MMASLTKHISLMALLRLTRSYNLLIIILTQYLVYLFLINNSLTSMEKLMDVEFLIISLSTVAIAAGGYIINDYHDIKIDMINKPGRVVIGQFFSRRKALITYLLLCFTGIFFGFLVSYKIGLINLLSAALLWIYSVRFKKTALWGNVSIALLTALSILMIYVWRPVLGGNSILVYSWFAFIITLIREAIKDIEDIRGDKAYGCKTLPILWGIAPTVKFIQLMIAIMSITLVMAIISASNIPLIIFGAIVAAELIYLSYSLSKTDTNQGFRSLGKFCKIIMLTGILAMFFF